MLLYILYFALIIFFAQSLGNNENGEKNYLIFAFGVMWLMIGLRPISVGVDTYSYVDAFLRIKLDYLKESKEPLYVISTYLIRQVTDNYHIYFLIMQSGYCLALYYLLKKYLHTPREALVSIVLLFLLGVFAFSVAGLRQTIAIGFVIFAALAAEESKWKQYALFMAIAVGFHTSALTMAPMFLLRKFDLKYYSFLLVFAMGYVGYLMPGDVLSFLVPKDSIVEERFGYYGTIYESSQNYTGFFLQLIVVVFAFIRKQQIDIPKETKNFLFNMAFIGLGFQSMTIIVAEFFRLSLYFCIFDVVLAPLAISSFGKSKSIVRVLFIIGCLFYIFILAGTNVLPLSLNT